MRKILFVDDDQNVLDGLRRMLRPMRAEWDMRFTDSGPNGLQLMENEPFDVVVSDMRMPGMDGAQFLNEVMRLYPRTVRFVLSGQSDRETIFRSIGPTHQFLSKPCDADTLKQVVACAFALRDVLHSEPLKALVSQIDTLPSLPDTYTHLMEELQSADPSIQRVGDIISQDMAMSAKVLQLVNSAFFGLRSHVTSPAQAASLLGQDVIRSLVLVVHVFSRQETICEGLFSAEVLQHHSLFVGTGAQAIGKYEKMDRKKADNLFIAGILHDLGKLVLAANLSERYTEVLKRFHAGEARLIEIEREVFGATHAEVGAYLLGLWGFPDPVIEAVAFHHEPRQYSKHEFDALTAVHVANALSGVTRIEIDGPLYEVVDLEYIKNIGMLENYRGWEQVVSAIGKAAS
ncbi:MAG: HDOD domain-containing protein [Spartobacteria bacterium]|nr:HDOD domain-containing protein [Spartobacteria bacterium]